MKETEEEPQGTGQAAVTFIISLAAVGYMCYVIFGQMVKIIAICINPFHLIVNLLICIPMAFYKTYKENIEILKNI